MKIETIAIIDVFLVLDSNVVNVKVVVMMIVIAARMIIVVIVVMMKEIAMIVIIQIMKRKIIELKIRWK